MPTGERKDPYRGYNFRVEIDNTTLAGKAPTFPCMCVS
jgi:hypothetical protein